MNDTNYTSLRGILDEAYAQAATGKGAERHGNGLPFTEQPMQVVSGLLGSPTGLYFQAIKKIQEAHRMTGDARRRELLGAINYIAGVLVYEDQKKQTPPLGTLESMPPTQPPVYTLGPIYDNPRSRGGFIPD